MVGVAAFGTRRSATLPSAVWDRKRNPIGILMVPGTASATLTFRWAAFLLSLGSLHVYAIADIVWFRVSIRGSCHGWGLGCGAKRVIRLVRIHLSRLTIYVLILVIVVVLQSPRVVGKRRTRRAIFVYLTIVLISMIFRRTFNSDWLMLFKLAVIWLIAFWNDL